jgi:hypothetical protein
VAEKKDTNIAEKVRFWEEQDKINQALIPRVMEIHGVVRDLSKRMGDINSQIAAAEARVLQRVRAELQSDNESTRRQRHLRLTSYVTLVLAALAFALSIYQLLM